MTKHVHCDLIKAWADGEEIEILFSNAWWEVKVPRWNPKSQYRIKPKQPVYRLYLSEDGLVNVAVKDFCREEDKLLALLEKRTNINWLTEWLPLPFKPKETQGE